MLVAGGDGTVGMVADALRRRREPPPMAIAPLGTGNDLARVLGWSGDVWDDSRLFSERRVVSTLRRARPQRVDRWALEIARPRRRSTKKKLFSNYMGIGVDARAALAFDSARKDRRWTWLFVHALTNKLLYAVFGARDFIEHSFAGLKRDVEVTVDGKVIDFPEDTEGIILLNINSFSGGVRMWATRDEFTKSLKDDGVLEIVAVSGALHLGQLNARLAKPVQVAQGRDVSIELKRDLPVQIDGEPWLQRGAATLRVSLNDSFTMLRRPRQDQNQRLARALVTLERIRERRRRRDVGVERRAPRETSPRVRVRVRVRAMPRARRVRVPMASSARAPLRAAPRVVNVTKRTQKEQKNQKNTAYGARTRDHTLSLNSSRALARPRCVVVVVRRECDLARLGLRRRRLIGESLLKGVRSTN